jgi:hypothetical protein
MDINVRLMREGEAVRSIADSTVIAEEGQILLELKDEATGSIGVVLLEPMAAQSLAIQLSQAAHAGAETRRYKLHFGNPPEVKTLQIDKDGRGGIWGGTPPDPNDIRAEDVASYYRAPEPRGLWALLFGGRK